jgi:hypothetical protein
VIKRKIRRVERKKKRRKKRKKKKLLELEVYSVKLFKTPKFKQIY